ncbi:MAG: hypothetical protein CMH57_01350 [Myxococcales bacterium]|nr:hypothetical protein [Myxococcales bacterium]
MNPYLTDAGRALLVTTILFIVVGSISGAWVLLLLGVTLSAVLVLACASLLPGALVLERRLVKVEVEAADDGAELARLVTGQPVRLMLTIINRGSAALRRVSLTPRLGSSLEVVEHAPQGFGLIGGGALSCDVSLVTRETGRHMLHGFHIRVRDVLGLFEVGEYVASSVPLKFLPNIRWGQAMKPDRSIKAVNPDRIGLHFVVQRGFGTELRELRHHHHGDPFRDIAWKATARTGRLMVKEYESEQLLNTYLCLDISSTMRGGYRHAADVPSKLEHALRMAASYARASLTNSDRVGLITFDEKIYGHIHPREGKGTLNAIMNHLVGLRHVVDEGLTEYTDAEVTELIVRYLMVQERLDFRRRDVKRVKGIGQGADYWSFSRDVIDSEQSEFDVELLRRWIGSIMGREQDRFGDPALASGVVGYPETDLIRRFCHLRGLEIPYRVETRLGQKERGLVQALEEIVSHARDSHLVVIISDLCGIMNHELILRGLRLARVRRHKVVFLTPFTPDYVQKGELSGRATTLHELFTLAELDERTQIADAISQLGIPIIPIGPEVSLQQALRELGARTRRRR